MPPVNTQAPLKEKLTVLDAARNGFDASLPFAERVNMLTAQSTQPLSDAVMRDNPAKAAAYGAEATYPFTPEAKAKLADLKVRGVLPGGSVAEDSRVEGQYRVKGKGIYQGVHSVLPASLSSWVADKLGFADPASITVDTNNMGSKDAQETAAHEMIHHLAQTSPINNDKTAVSWLNAWDKVKGNDGDIGPLLSEIDHNYNSGGYPKDDPYSIAQERYAYLGEMAIRYGIDIIPKELQPFYHGIIEGAPAPSDEQLGKGIDPAAGFNIDMNRYKAPRQSRFSESPGGKAINYFLGRTVVENGGTPPPKTKEKPAPVPVAPPTKKPDEARKVILGTLFGEVSNRTSDKQMLEARTILNTARNRAKQNGTTVLEELTKPNQYQGYGGKEYKRFIAGKTEKYDQQKIASISAVLDELNSGKLTDNTGGTTHYVHVTSGAHTGSIVFMTPREFDTYYKKRGKARDTYASSLIGG